MVRLLWTEWFQLPPGDFGEVSPTYHSIQFLDALLITQSLWLLKTVLVIASLRTLHKHSFEASLASTAIESRALARLCCDNTFQRPNLERCFQQTVSYESLQASVESDAITLPLRRVRVQDVEDREGARPANAPLYEWQFCLKSTTFVTSVEEMQTIAHVLWANVASNPCDSVKSTNHSLKHARHHRVLTLDKWLSYFPEKAEARRAFWLLFSGGVGHHHPYYGPGIRAPGSTITYEEFENSLVQFWLRWSKLSSRLKSWDDLTRVIRHIGNGKWHPHQPRCIVLVSSNVDDNNWLRSGIFWIIIIFVVAGVYGISMQTVLVSMSSLMLSVAFAFGDTISKMVESVIFIFGTHPYDVGDRISVDGKFFKVVAVYLLTTHLRSLDNQYAILSSLPLLSPLPSPSPSLFLTQSSSPCHPYPCLCCTGLKPLPEVYTYRIMIASNQRLSSRTTIYNLRRTESARIRLNFEIDFRTDLSRLKDLRKSMLMFFKRHHTEWQEDFEFFVSDTDRNTSMTLNIWARHRLSWQMDHAMNMATSDLIHFVRERMIEMQISCTSPTLPIRNEVAGE